MQGLPLELPVKLVCHLGLRRGEALGLCRTFAGMANSARAPMYKICRTMGHSSPSITQRICTHLFGQTHGEVPTAVADTIVSAASA